MGVLGCEPSMKFRGRKLVFLRGFLLPFSDLPLSVTNAFLYIFSIWQWIINFSFFFSFFFFCNDWLILGYVFFSCQVQLNFPNICLYSDILCICLQLKTSIHQLSHPKKSSATEGCETHPTARPRWWGKRRWFYSLSSFQMGSERKSDAGGGGEGGRDGGNACERYFRGGCCWWWDGGSLDGWEGAN